MAPRLLVESATTKLKTPFRKEEAVVVVGPPPPRNKLTTTVGSLMKDDSLLVSSSSSSSKTDQSSNGKENQIKKKHFKPLEGTPERGGYETTAVDNQVLVQDSSESAASASASSSSSPSSPRCASLELDRFGFIRHLQQPRADEIDDDNDDKIPTLAEQQCNKRRTQKWNVLLASNYFALLHRRSSRRRRQRAKKLVVKRLRKGVPHGVRPQVWAALCQTEQKMKQHPGLYQQLVRESAHGGGGQQQQQASSPLSSSSSSWTTAAVSPDVERAFQKIQDTIERDIHRTFPRHILFYDSEEDNNNNNGLPNVTASSGEETASAAGFCHTTDLQEMIRDLELNGTTMTTAAPQEVTTTTSSSNAAAAPAAVPAQQSQQLDHPDARSPEIVMGSKGGQASLRRVLKAYSVYDREIGYCQGMNFIAGMFLTLVPEEQAFWMLVGKLLLLLQKPFVFLCEELYKNIHVFMHVTHLLFVSLYNKQTYKQTAVMYDEPCKMRGLFAEGMHETHMVLYVAEKLVHQFLPKLAKHLDKEHIHVTMYATQWLLTQYTSSFRFDLVTRVWDSFLGEGWKITYRVMLSILQHYQSELLRMSFEEILAFMRDLPGRVNGPVVFDASIKIPLRRKHIAKYEKQWHAQQQQQQQS